MFIVFIAALFIIAKPENRQCPSAGKYITNTMETLLSNKKKSNLYSSATRIILTIILLNQNSQMQESTYCMILPI